MKRDFIFGIFVLVVILGMWFVMAILAPINFHFEQNTTANYDKEGIFTVNWTNVSGATNHNLYIRFSNGTVFQTILNTTNKSLNTAINANFTFIAESMNTTNSTRVNSSLLWMIVDTVVPAISYNSNTDSNNSFLSRTFIFVNVSATDINNVSSNLTFFLYNASAGLLRNNATNYTTNTFNWTSLTDGVYTFNVTANDSATNSNSTQNRTITLDTTVPAISYNSGTETDNSAADRDFIFVNVSASDINNASSNLTYDLYNGTSGALVRSNATNYTTTTFNWTSLAEGKYIFNVTANDSAANSNSAASRTFYLDRTNPTATAACTSSVYEGDAFPCTCSGTDSLTSVTTSQSSTSGSTTDTTLTGTFTYTCSVTDNAGNSASDTETYTVLDIGGGGGGGGGGGASAGPPQEVHSWTKITPGAAVIMQNFDSEIGVKQIEVTVANEAQNVVITVIKYDGKPANVTVAKTGKVYQYLQISAKNLASNLDKATVQFRVEKSWVTSNEVNKSNIAAYKFDGVAGKWNELQTTFVSEDSTHYYYDVELDSFSYFTIGEEAAAVPVETGGEPATVGDEGRNLTWLWILIALVIVAVIWSMTRKKVVSKRR